VVGGLVLAFLALGCVGFEARSQGTSPTSQDQMDVKYEAVYVTSRIFQLRAKKGTSQDLSDQVFRLPTASMPDYEKWIMGLKQVYPGYNIELLRTDQLRVMKSPRPAIVPLSDRAGRRLEFRVSAATSIGDGVKPGTSIIVEVEAHFGSKPVSLMIHPFEGEEGMTYFFTSQQLMLDPTNYANFIRPDVSPQAFDGENIFLVSCLSISFNKPVETARVLDEKKFAELQAGATNKGQPTLSAALRQKGLGGAVRVSVEIAPDGSVAHADILNSSLPEANDEVIAAARQWKFPTSAFAESKQPIKGVLTFKFDAAPPKPTPPPGAPKDGSK
jgi:TonB family protein